MGKIKGIISKVTGSVGDLTFKTVKGQTVVSEKMTRVNNVRSAAQQRHRMKWANIIQMYKGISPLINYGFECKRNGVTDYNMFVKINSHLVPVYLTREMVTGGACVVTPYQITQGTLPAIAVTGEGNSKVTDIALGALVIDENTTVATFSNAVVLNNADYNYGDQLAFYRVIQRVNATTGVPYGEFAASSVVLDKKSDAVLWSLVHPEGFQTTEGFLGHEDNEVQGAFCWVHSRKNNGKTLVSTQCLLVNNDILADYTSKEAYKKAVATYGGEKEVFLTPATEMAENEGSNSPSTGGSSTPSQPTARKYTLTVKANNDSYGTVEGGGEYAENASATLKAIAKSGYEFKQWNDGNTAATRVVTVVSDKTYTATFSQQQSDEEGTI